MTPIIVFFLAMQKHIIEGITAGSVKGYGLERSVWEKYPGADFRNKSGYNKEVIT